MKILIDSHILLWSLQEPHKINESARSIMQNSTERYFSIASLWELALKHSKGKLLFSTKEILKGIEQLDFKILQLSPEHILRLNDKFFMHKDPFDNILLAQAKAEELQFITADNEITSLGLEFITNASTLSK